jgi:serine/threonine protein kinase
MQNYFSRLFGDGKDDGRSPSEPASDPAVQSDSWPKGTVLLNEFVIEDEIGEGGMGKVYLAKSRSADHQFAVKRTKVLDDSSRRNFQTELQVWIELPEYPHLVACRFFRTIGDEVAIFAQYIEGGSLADWIRDKRLTSVPQILDVSIQTAWGLHALHELGLVHHDMKPSNVLMTSDGLAKVTDFGLAKARVSAGERPSTLTTRGSILVSSGGRTPAYCSPEQAAGLEVTKKTDIWSWAVSVLEMFTGEVTWAAGQAADMAFDDYWSNVSQSSLQNGIAPMPRAVATIVRKCFKQNPAERWANLADVAEELKKVYRETSGRAYARQMPPLPQRSGKAIAGDHDVIQLGGNSARAFQWLCAAYQAAGQNAPNRDVWRNHRTTSPKVQAISDLALFDEAQRTFQKLVASGRRNLENQLALLCLEKAEIHWQAEDYFAGLVCYDYAINTWRKALASHNDYGIAKHLASALQAKASSLSMIGELQSTSMLAGEAIKIFELLIEQTGDSSLKQQLAYACHTKANAAFEVADYDIALEFYSREITFYEQFTTSIEGTDHSLLLADAYMSKGNTIWASGNPKGGLVWHDKAIAILDRMVKAGRDDLSRSLAKACYNKAITLRSAGDIKSALEWHDRSVQNYERLVHQQGRWQIANELANVYIARANAMCEMSQSKESLVCYEKAIDIYDTLANQQGRQEFAGDLARVRALYAQTLSNLGEHDRAAMEAERAIPVLEREAARTGRSDLKSTLQSIKNITLKT